jgi:hypothetical protein
MSISERVRAEVRQRAHFACEFCGVSEVDTGGLLTIDHFKPRSAGGTDSPDNLIYCCIRCNQYKHHYWPQNTEAPQLWNPRMEPASHHLLELDDGALHPLTEIGAFTIRRLRLNRSPLVAYRLRKRHLVAESQLLRRYLDLLNVQEQLLVQQSILLEEQQQLLHGLQTYLGLLIRFMRQ